MARFAISTKKGPVRNRRIVMTLGPNRPGQGRRILSTRPGRKAEFDARVKRIVGRLAETKYITRQIEKDVDHNSAIGPSDFYKVFPEISQGTSELQRIGDKLSPKSLYVRGTVALDRNYLDSNRPIQVRVLCLGLKSARTWPNALSTWTGAVPGSIPAYSSLLKVNDEAGAIQNKPYNGDTQDNTYPINKDMFIVYASRLVTLYPQQQTVSATASSTSVESGNRITKNFMMKIKCPAVITYSDTNSNTPQNFAPFLSVGYQYLDGTGPDVLSTKVIMNVNSHLYFKDS